VADADVGWAHASAIHTMLTAATPYDVYIGDVTVPDDELEFPYLVVWPPPGTRPTITLNGYGGEATTRTQVTGAGRTVREVLAVLDRASAALHRRRPTIPGRACSLMRQVPGTADVPQPRRDPKARTRDGLPILSSFLQFSLFSSPAPEEP
jgi:hypothetical protein